MLEGKIWGYWTGFVPFGYPFGMPVVLRDSPNTPYKLFTLLIPKEPKQEKVRAMDGKISSERFQYDRIYIS